MFINQKYANYMEAFQNVNHEAINNISQFAQNMLTQSALNVPYNLNTTAKIQENGYALIPRGVIVAWSGIRAPAGWALCDGKNRTPDLRGRFLLGMGKGSGLTNRTLRQTGGTETHTLTVEQMPSHNHNTDLRQGSGSGNKNGWQAVGNWHNGRFVGYPDTRNTGGGRAHNNMPPFYVLAYIMKL